MTLLLGGMAVFFGMHLLPAFPLLRARLIAAVGKGCYKSLFAAVSLAGFAGIVLGMAQAADVPLWTPPAWGRHATAVLMVAAFVLLAAYGMPGNIRRYTRHPMLWGVTLWSAAHLIANGNRAGVLLFGVFGAYALFAMWSANHRGAHKSTVTCPLTSDLAAMVVGLLFYGVFAALHPYLFGVHPFT